jgi:pyridoxal phosphate enzyme (YggS family)|tara:strand:- start:62 stop:712 length:651 start_codon:yes stop_codon:yes gene_type:complete
MHSTIQNLLDIQNKIKVKSVSNKSIKIIAVTKTFEMEKIKPLLEHGHLDFGENKVQEALEKWADYRQKNSNIKLHLIGGLQTNKVKIAVKLFDYIHSVDNEKLAKKISQEEVKNKKKLKIFIQVNIGEEKQKSGIKVQELDNFYLYCKKLDLNIIGLMCIPPNNEDPNIFFDKLNLLNKKLNLPELSMGMSQDFLSAIDNNATYVRIGSQIFGKRN